MSDCDEPARSGRGVKHSPDALGISYIAGNGERASAHALEVAGGTSGCVAVDVGDDDESACDHPARARQAHSAARAGYERDIHHPPSLRTVLIHSESWPSGMREFPPCTTPETRSPSISPPDRPRTDASTSLVCSPTLGAGVVANTSPGDLDGGAEEPQVSSVGMILRVEELAGTKVRVIGKLVGCVDGAARHVVVNEQAHPFRARPGPEDRDQLAAQLLITACVITERLSRLGLKEVETADRGTEVAPELLLGGLKEHLAIVCGAIILIANPVSKVCALALDVIQRSVASSAAQRAAAPARRPSITTSLCLTS